MSPFSSPSLLVSFLVSSYFLSSFPSYFPSYFFSYFLSSFLYFFHFFPGKSSLLNRLSRAGVLAENMLFATLDPTTRRIRLPRSGGGEGAVVLDANAAGARNKGQEVWLVDTHKLLITHSLIPHNKYTSFFQPRFLFQNSLSLLESDSILTLSRPSLPRCC